MEVSRQRVRAFGAVSAPVPQASAGGARAPSGGPCTGKMVARSRAMREPVSAALPTPAMAIGDGTITACAVIDPNGQSLGEPRESKGEERMSDCREAFALELVPEPGLVLVSSADNWIVTCRSAPAEAGEHSVSSIWPA